MISETEFWIETGAIASVVALFPLYLGYIHTAPGGALLYALAGGVAMTIAEALVFPHQSRPTVVGVASEVGLWSTAIGGIGGIIYVLALMFI